MSVFQPDVFQPNVFQQDPGEPAEPSGSGPRSMVRPMSRGLITPLIIPLICVLIVLGARGCKSNTEDRTDRSASMRNLGVIAASQSNGMGLGRLSLVTYRPEVATPLAAVPWISRVSALSSVQYIVDGPGPLRARTKIAASQPVGSFGVELTLGADLNAAMPDQWAMSKVANDGAGLEDHILNRAYADPTVLERTIEFIRADEVTFNARFRGIWMLEGERDSSFVVPASRYLTNLRFIRDTLTAEFGPIFMIMSRPSPTFNGSQMPVVNAAITAFVAETPGAAVIDVSGLSTIDNTHWNTTSLQVLGERFAVPTLQYIQQADAHVGSGRVRPLVRSLIDPMAASLLEQRVARTALRSQLSLALPETGSPAPR